MSLNLKKRLVWWPNFQSLADANNWLDIVDIVWYDTAVTSTKGDWLKLHQLIETYNKSHQHQVKVVRRLAKYLVPDVLPPSFDSDWAHQLAFIDVGDEEEDKQRNSNGQLLTIYNGLSQIIQYFTNAANEARAALPKIPVLANFNGTHINPSTIPWYKQIIDSAKLDGICSDCYPNANQQVSASGALLYPDMLAEALNGPSLLRKQYPLSTGKQVFGFVDTCNELLFQKGAPGWSTGWTAVGSRAWTPQELLAIAQAMSDVGLDGIAYFPQQRGGATNDATDSTLLPTLRLIAGLTTSTTPTPTPTTVKRTATASVKLDTGEVLSGTLTQN